MFVFATVPGGSSTVVASGSYTPVFIPEDAAIAVIALGDWIYLRIGDMVLITGSARATFPGWAAPIVKAVEFSLPIASAGVSGQAMQGGTSAGDITTDTPYTPTLGYMSGLTNGGLDIPSADGLAQTFSISVAYSVA